jgi:hypothetical protein
MNSPSPPKPPPAPDPPATTPPNFDTTVPVDLDESVAGEEDPGASLDLAIDTPAPAGKPKP